MIGMAVVVVVTAVVVAAVVIRVRRRRVRGRGRDQAIIIVGIVRIQHQLAGSAASVQTDSVHDLRQYVRIDRVATSCGNRSCRLHG